jgi:nucleotide-binding universal stress UspA family protein
LGALSFLIDNISIRDVRVDVIHVLPPFPIPMAVVEPMFMDVPAAESWKTSEEELNRRRKEEENGELLLENCTDQLKKTGIKASGILKRGDAASIMIDYAKSEDLNLIITGSRGLSQLKSWLMGSVSRKLVHYSNCSILVVRDKK